MSQLEPQDQAQLFRRRRFAAPHRRRHPLRRLARPLGASLAVVGLPAVAAWWIMTAPHFRIERVEAVASERVSADWLDDRLADLGGRHLLAVRLSEIEGRLAGHPWIADLVVRRQLPARLEVRVVERLPAALLAEGDRLVILDRSGLPIAPLDGDGGALDLPLISAPAADAADAGGAGGAADLDLARAIRLASSWERLRPGDEVSQIEILRSGDFRLVTGRLPFTVVVGGERLESALAMLTRALDWIERRPPQLARMGRVGSVDLRFSRQIVFQPAAEPHVFQMAAEPPGEEG